MEQALDRPPTELDASAEVVAALSPLQQNIMSPMLQNALNPPEQKVFFIDTEDYEAQIPVLKSGNKSKDFPDDGVLW